MTRIKNTWSLEVAEKVKRILYDWETNIKLKIPNI